jgi:hypothetical protein
LSRSIRTRPSWDWWVHADRSRASHLRDSPSLWSRPRSPTDKPNLLLDEAEMAWWSAERGDCCKGSATAPPVIRLRAEPSPGLQHTPLLFMVNSGVARPSRLTCRTPCSVCDGARRRIYVATDDIDLDFFGLRGAKTKGKSSYLYGADQAIIFLWYQIKRSLWYST